MFVIFMFFGAIIATLGYTFLRDLNKISQLHYDKGDLVKEKEELKEKEDAIKKITNEKEKDSKIFKEKTKI